MPSSSANPTPPTPTARLDGFGPLWITYDIVPPKLLPPAGYFTITRLLPWVALLQPGLPQQYVNIAPWTRPVCCANAFFWNLRQFAFHFAPGDSVGLVDMTSVPTLCGPVMAKLVPSWMIAGAFFTGTAAVIPGSGWFRTIVGSVNVPPTPAPVVTIFLSGLKPAQPLSFPFGLFAPRLIECPAGVRFGCIVIVMLRI